MFLVLYPNISRKKNVPKSFLFDLNVVYLQVIRFSSVKIILSIYLQFRKRIGRNCKLSTHKNGLHFQTTVKILWTELRQQQKSKIQKINNFGAKFGLKIKINPVHFQNTSIFFSIQVRHNSEIFRYNLMSPKLKRVRENWNPSCT